MSRVLLVSNRLPITVRRDHGEPTFERSAGGLATGLASQHTDPFGLWIGWPGIASDELAPSEREVLDRRFANDRLVPVHLTAADVARFYAGFSNGVIWPVFHYFPARAPLDTDDWQAYREVNARYADAIAAAWQPGDLVWIHDYQLLLVPALLRARVPDAAIGLFLHIPFPASEVYRTLPGRQDLLAGMLGADLIGFHTLGYVRHFSAAVHLLLGVPTSVDVLSYDGRPVRLRALPMGIDAAEFGRLADTDQVRAVARAIRANGNGQVVLSIDRLDYTKGLPRRLLAFERLLIRQPELHNRVRLVSLVVPSREEVDAYQDFRTEVEALVSRINGRFGTATWTPIHYMYRHMPEPEVASLYRAADVMLVTPVRDGMNLVAKEYVASRTDDDGVLVLSEFAGAADELVEAVLVNPYEVDSTAAAFYSALTMPPEERHRRMRALRTRVGSRTVQRWVADFLSELAAAAERRRALSVSLEPEELERAVRAVGRSSHLVLLLDYDGTLVPYHPDPERAIPDAELMLLLGQLAVRPDTDVHIVSGRSRRFLTRWLGRLPVYLHAEHGGWSRSPGSDEWTAPFPFSLEWREILRPVLDDFAKRTPGASVEEKELGLTWHWRAADPEIGGRHANELGLYLLDVGANLPVDILVGDRVVELRPQGATKAYVAARATRNGRVASAFLAAGDDRTDEDLFGVLPPSACTIHVGEHSTLARFAVPDCYALRDVLTQLVTSSSNTRLDQA